MAGAARWSLLNPKRPEGAWHANDGQHAPHTRRGQQAGYVRGRTFIAAGVSRYALIWTTRSLESLMTRRVLAWKTTLETVMYILRVPAQAHAGCACRRVRWVGTAVRKAAGPTLALQPLWRQNVPATEAAPRHRCGWGARVWECGQPFWRAGHAGCGLPCGAHQRPCRAAHTHRAHSLGAMVIVEPNPPVPGSRGCRHVAGELRARAVGGLG